MAYCRNCGAQIADQSVLCPKCGASQTAHPVERDNNSLGGFGWGLFGFCVPVAGLVLCRIWKDTRPKTSQILGVSALLATIVWIVIYGLAFIFVCGILR